MIAKVLKKPLLFWAILLTYYILQLVLRYASLESLEWDQSEQAYLSQWYASGYGIQPPLFNWLQKLIIDLSGDVLFSLLFFKISIIIGTQLLIYHSVKLITGRHLPAIVAVLSMFLFPQYFWESLRDLSHTVLATFLCAAIFYFVVRTVRFQAISDYALLGVSIGLAVITKYNTLLFILVTLLSGLSVREVRASILTSRILLTACFAMLISLPHAVWLYGQFDQILMSTFDKVSVSQEDFSLGKMLVGYANGLLGFLILYLLIFFAVSWKFITLKKDVWTKFLVYFLVIMSLVILITMFIGDLTEIKDRYLQTLFIVIPVLSALLVNFDDEAMVAKRLSITASCVGLLVFSAIVITVYFGDVIGKNGRYNKPYLALAYHLQTQGSAGLIVAQDFQIAGNLLAQIDDVIVVTPEDRGFKPSLKLIEGYMVWEGSKTIPVTLRQYLSANNIVMTSEVEKFTAFYHHSNLDSASWYYVTIFKQ